MKSPTNLTRSKAEHAAGEPAWPFLELGTESSHFHNLKLSTRFTQDLTSWTTECNTTCWGWLLLLSSCCRISTPPLPLRALYGNASYTWTCTFKHDISTLQCYTSDAIRYDTNPYLCHILTSVRERDQPATTLLQLPFPPWPSRLHSSFFHAAATSRATSLDAHRGTLGHSLLGYFLKHN